MGVFFLPLNKPVYCSALTLHDYVVSCILLWLWIHFYPLIKLNELCQLIHQINQNWLQISVKKSSNYNLHFKAFNRQKVALEVYILLNTCRLMFSYMEIKCITDLKFNSFYNGFFTAIYGTLICIYLFYLSFIYWSSYTLGCCIVFHITICFNSVLQCF